MVALIFYVWKEGLSLLACTVIGWVEVRAQVQGLAGGMSLASPGVVSWPCHSRSMWRGLRAKVNLTAPPADMREGPGHTELALSPGNRCACLMVSIGLYVVGETRCLQEASPWQKWPVSWLGRRCRG